MPRGFSGLVMVAGLGLLVGGARAAEDDKPPAGYVQVVKVDGIITSATHELIADARAKAEANDATALLIEMDTPGGLVASTREIVKEELNAKVPVIVFVGPKGARAGSAGVFITLAANIAAMAPGTNIGAAHPVNIGAPPQQSPTPGSRDSGEKKGKEDDEDEGNGFVYRSDQEHMARKIENDTVAWAEAIATERGRNVEWARDAVINSVSITADEALEKNVIDLIANDRDELLQVLDGRTVATEAGDRVLKTAGAAIVVEEMSPKQMLVSFLSHPTVLAILGLVMMLGLYAELNNPGMIFPAVIGGLALIALLIGSQLVSLNLVGILFIVLAFVLFFLEIKVTSYGMLTVGGIACLIAGAYLLVDKMEFSAPAVNWGMFAPFLIATVGIVAFVTWLAAKAQLVQRKADLSDMIGQTGKARTDLNPEGKVFLLGTLWTAESETPVEKGQKVRIVSVDGLRLKVEPDTPDSTP